MRNYHFVIVEPGEITQSLTVQALNYDHAARLMKERFPRARILAFDCSY
jgi:hypothetical protein